MVDFLLQSPLADIGGTLLDSLKSPIDDLKQEMMQKYEEVRSYFIDNPDEQCVPLFLNSFGGKDGLGVYQMVEEVILMYDSEIVLPHILN